MHPVRLGKRAHRIVQPFFTVLLFIGCFSANAPAVAAVVPSQSCYSYVHMVYGYGSWCQPTEAGAMRAAQDVAIGCASYSGGLTICYDAYEVVRTDPWSVVPGSWNLSRQVQTRIPVRRLIDGVTRHHQLRCIRRPDIVAGLLPEWLLDSGGSIYGIPRLAEADLHRWRAAAATTATATTTTTTARDGLSDSRTPAGRRRRLYPNA